MIVRKVGLGLLLAAACAAAPPAQSRPSGGDAPPGSMRQPGSLRVGLATDLPSVTVPCCPQSLVARFGGREIEVGEGLRIEPSMREAVAPVYRLQVAALRDELQAEELARRVGSMLAATADVVFQADDGLYRVRVGRFSTREEAEAAQKRLQQRNVEGSWIASEQTPLDSSALRLTWGDRAWIAPGRSIELFTRSGGGIPLLDKRYRGDIIVFLNGRGTLNLINRVSVDDYLRGVVPREMGPEVYNNLDALKAQAIAARTYTLRNLGEFSGEGYDICATPRCQVYGGMAAEHDLSDRAVRETSGQVLLFNGGLADALYSATCGGHTEDVEVVFPLKLHPYLRGVPCLEAGAKPVGRPAGAARPFASEVLAGVLRRGTPTRSPGEFAARAKALATMAGAGGTTAELASFERRAVRGFLASLIAGGNGDGAAIRWSDFGLAGPDLSGRLPLSEADPTLLRLAVFLGVVERHEQGFLALSEGRLLLRGEVEDRAWASPPQLPTYRKEAGRLARRPVELVPGDRVTVFSAGDRLLALVQEEAARRDTLAASRNLAGRGRAWSFFRADRELAELIGQRYPELGFSGLEIRARGVSGRVAELRILGSRGDSIDVTGLPIRWTLDLPDTLFTAQRLTSPSGVAGWQFSGRGWGHGVGMCQVGAFGMALRGNSYRDILDHYYTGLEIVTLGTEERTRLAAR